MPTSCASCSVSSSGTTGRRSDEKGLNGCEPGNPTTRESETVVPRFKLTIEYAGTRYSGWQIQKNARTIQGEIDRAVRAVTRRNDFELYGAGRTDAGVHAVA